MTPRFSLYLFTAATLLSHAGTADDTFTLDPNHTDIGFAVTHMVINKVNGKFKEHEGELVINDRGRLTAARAVIKTASINTEIQARDDHLRSADFLSVEAFPEMTFESTRVRRRFGKNAMIGKLTIRDVTRRVVLWYQLKGPITDPWGNRRVGFEASTTISRADFGLTWNQVLESGGLMVGDEIEISINLEAIAEE